MGLTNYERQVYSLLNPTEATKCENLGCRQAMPMYLVENKPLGCGVTLTARQRGLGTEAKVLISDPSNMANVIAAIIDADRHTLTITATDYRHTIPDNCPRFQKTANEVVPR